MKLHNAPAPITTRLAAGGTPITLTFRPPQSATLQAEVTAELYIDETDVTLRLVYRRDAPRGWWTLARIAGSEPDTTHPATYAAIDYVQGYIPAVLVTHEALNRASTTRRTWTKTVPAAIAPSFSRAWRAVMVGTMYRR